MNGDTLRATGILVIVATLALLASCLVNAQTIDIKRLGAEACQCQSDAGVKISSHTSDIEAIDACADKAFADGKKKRLVCSYEITVTKPAAPTPAPTTGSMLLTWTAPVMRTNFKPLPAFDIVGYIIYYGTSPTALAQQTTVGPVLTVSIGNLAPGTWYASITCLALSETTPRVNEESARSGQASKVIG